MNRRNWLKTAAGLLVAAPMVVRAENIMRVRTPLPAWGDILRDSVPIAPPFIETVEYNITDDSLFVLRTYSTGRRVALPYRREHGLLTR
jgi:hypothetical protein